MECRHLCPDALASDHRQDSTSTWPQVARPSHCADATAAVVKEFKELIAAAEAKTRGLTPDAVTASALEWRTNVQIIKAIAETLYNDVDAEVLAATRGQVDESIASKADQIERDHGSLLRRR